MWWVCTVQSATAPWPIRLEEHPVDTVLMDALLVAADDPLARTFHASSGWEGCSRRGQRDWTHRILLPHGDMIPRGRQLHRMRQQESLNVISVFR